MLQKLLYKFLTKNGVITTSNKFISILVLGIIFIVCNLLLTQNTHSQSVTWQREFPQYFGVIFRVQQTYDGGYVAIGSILVSGTYKMRLMKFNLFGDTLWSKIIGVGSTDGFWVEETFDRGLIIGGSTDSGIGNSKAYLVKTDSLGNIQWQKTFSNSDIDQCHCVKQTPDGGYILSCRTDPFVFGGVMFIKTDQFGNLIWLKPYADSLTSIVIRELQVLQDGYIATGRKGDYAASDVYVMRLDLNGDTLWTKKFGGNNSDGCFSIAVVPPPHNGFILGGSSKSFSTNGNANSYVVKIDNNGNLEWQKIYTSNGGYDVCESVIYKPSMGYILAGTSDSLNNHNINKGKIRKIDFSGNVIYETSFLPGGDETVFKNLNLTIDGGLILGGYSGNGYPDYYIVKTDSLGFANPIGMVNLNHYMPFEPALFQNYPNPFNPNTIIRFEIPASGNVEFRVYDILGRVIYSINEFKTAGSYEVRFDGSNLASGMYFYSIETGKFRDVKKMVLVK